jgi:hypothetical protein
MSTVGAGHFTVRLVPPLPWGTGTGAVPAARLSTLDGITLALVANGKANGEELLDDLAAELTRRHGVATVLRHTKPHPSLPLDDDVLTMFAEHAHAVLSAIGD